MPASRVPDPWTPVWVSETDGGFDVGVQGRALHFGEGSALPVGINTGGREILTGPMRLVGETDGEEMVWETRNANCTVHSRDNGQCTLIGWQSCQRMAVNTAMWIEYDGCTWLDVKVMPWEAEDGDPPLAVPKLHLEIPIAADAATLFHFWPQKAPGMLLDHDAANSGAVGNGLALPFKPFLWLGWEEGGLSWFAESNKGWQPADPQGTIEVVRDGDSIVLRLRLLDSEPAIWKDQPLLWARRPAPITFRMGFQPTPVKPWAGDVHTQRIAFHYTHKVGEHKDDHREGLTVLERMVEDGIRTVICHEAWQLIQNYGFSHEPKKVRASVDLCHSHNMKVLAYFGYELASLAPEWGDAADKCLVLNDDGVPGGGWRRWPSQRDYVVCTNSYWGDKTVELIGDAVDRFGFDGLYLDQTGVPFGCCNEAHGCGWRDADGTLHPTYPIRAARGVMQKLYDIIHPRGGWIELHQSSCCVTPSLAFGHSYYDGEHLHWNADHANYPLETIGLDAFRAEFMGWNYGVPADYMAAGEHQALPLVHGVLNRPLPTRQENRHSVWDVLEGFDVDSAQFLGYWREELPVTVDAETVKASAYLRAGEMLLIVANLSGRETVEAAVTVDVAAAGLHSGAAIDATSDEAVPIADGLMAFSLAPHAFRLISLH